MRGGNPIAMAGHDNACDRTYKALRAAAAVGDLNAYYLLSQATRSFNPLSTASQRTRTWMDVCKATKARQTST